MIKNASEQFIVDRTIRIEAPQDAVFKLVSDESQLARWQPMDFFEPRIGGKYKFAKGEWIAVGEIVEFDPPRVVAFTWDWQNSPIGARTVVKFELKKDGNGTLVHFTHTGFLDAERSANHAEGWTHYLARLKTVAEGGDPGPDTMGA
jgi:uncharacterized protein YndB with AHSA1/START domain